MDRITFASIALISASLFACGDADTDPAGGGLKDKELQELTQEEEDEQDRDRAQQGREQAHDVHPVIQVGGGGSPVGGGIFVAPPVY